MKAHLFLAFVLLVALVIPKASHAALKSQLFGVQKNASDPYLSARGHLLVVGYTDEAGDSGFQVWDVATRRPIWKSSLSYVEMSRDEKCIVASSNPHSEEGDGNELRGVRFDWLDARDGHVLYHMDAPDPPQQAGEQAEEMLDHLLSPDGYTLRLATQSYLYILLPRDSLVQSQQWTQGQAYTRLKDITFSSFKDEAIGTDSNNRIGLFDSSSGAQLRRITQNPAFNYPKNVDFYLTLSPDGFSFVQSDAKGDYSDRLFRLSDGKLMWRPTNGPTFSEDGQHAYIQVDSGVDVFDAHTGKKLRSIVGPEYGSFDLSFDEKWLYEVVDDKIYRWPIS